MNGVMSPSMFHTSRPRSGMRGAPELAPEHIGNVTEFNKFLKLHAQYAASARDTGLTWQSVAGLLSRYADDLAIAFTAGAIKRGENTIYTTDSVLNLSDDVFEKLYVESCFPSVEFPSQVSEALESIAFLRQAPTELSPLPAMMRAAEAFRVELRLLPTHAVRLCTPENIMLSFFKLLFGADAARKRMDLQQCTDWEQARAILIQRASMNPNWFGDSLKSAGRAPDQNKGFSSPAPSTSVSSNEPSQKPASYYDKRIAQLRKDGDLDGLNVEGLTPKHVVKLAMKKRAEVKAAADASAAAAEQRKQLESAVAAALTKQRDEFSSTLKQQSSALLALQQSVARAQQQRERSSERGNYDARSDGRNENRSSGYRSHSQDPQRRRDDSQTRSNSYYERNDANSPAGSYRPETPHRRPPSPKPPSEAGAAPVSPSKETQRRA
jgi:hypothetical protein